MHEILFTVHRLADHHLDAITIKNDSSNRQTGRLDTFDDPGHFVICYASLASQSQSSVIDLVNVYD
jgi:hypothetical protein